MALQHLVCFLAAVAPEMGVQQINHGPQMAAFLDVHLEQVAQIVERRAGPAEVALLFDRSGFGIALGDDQAAQFGAVLARHLVPHRLALVLAEGDLPVLFGRGEKDTPAIFRHPQMAVMGPTLGVDADGGAQVDLEVAGLDRTHIVPPLQIGRLPAFQRPQQAPVVGQADIVGNSLVIVDVHGLRLACGRNPAVYRCRTVSVRHPRRPRWGAGTPNSARR